MNPKSRFRPWWAVLPDAILAMSLRCAWTLTEYHATRISIGYVLPIPNVQSSPLAAILTKPVQK